MNTCKKQFFFFCCILISMATTAQKDLLADSLLRNTQTASTPEEKVEAFSRVADYHFNSNDSISKYYHLKTVETAEISRDRKLIIRTWLKLANRYLNNSAKKENLLKARDAANKGLDIALAEKLDEQSAFCQLTIARCWRLEGNNAKALEILNGVNNIAANTSNDSLKVRTFNALGDAYSMQSDNLQAFRNYMNALEIAENSGRHKDISQCYDNLSAFYQGIKQYEKAKDYAFRSLALDSTNKNWHSVLDDYNNIGKIYSAEKNIDMALYFFEKSIQKADAIGFEKYKINCYANITNMYFFAERYQEGLNYMQSNPALANFMITAGMESMIDFAKGSVYNQTGKLDSAGFYLKKSQPFFEQVMGVFNRFGFYSVYATYLKKRNDYAGAMSYLQKARSIADETKNMELLKYVYQQMDTLSALSGKYQLAYEYRGVARKFSDSLESLTKEKDLLAIEIDKENRQKEKKALEATQAKTRRHNIQYLGITAAIASIFILLVTAGLLSVSRGTVRIIGFFAFIFLFEFIILLADNQIHHWTHGEPWKIMAIKILLIALLLPLHHYLEHKVIHYLNEKNMLRIKKKNEANMQETTKMAG
jgi:tetratricopeptide (TPR) repeat protein